MEACKNMNLHAIKQDVVGCEKQKRKTASHWRSLISAFVIRSLQNSIAKLARPEISLYFKTSPCNWACWFELDLIKHH